MSESRKNLLLRALPADVGGAPDDPRSLFTEDVVGRAPIATVSRLTATRTTRPPL